jgi:hypothetical protein
MSTHVDEHLDFEELINRSRTKSKRLFVIVVIFVVVLLATLLPQIIDKYNSNVIGRVSAAEAEKQAKIWAKNSSCLSNDLDGSNAMTTENGDKLSAKICPSGDILIILTRNNSKYFGWVTVDEMVGRLGGK